jgi:Ribonuclease 2-5A
VIYLLTLSFNDFQSEHIKEKSSDVKLELMSKGKFYDYWADRFPGLLIHTWKVFLANLDHEAIKNSEVSAFYN